MRLVIATVYLFIAAGGALAAEQLPKFRPNTLYSDARVSLLELGWQPVPVNSKACERREATCETYPEAENCAPFGSAACTMLWKRSDQVMSVMTIGDGDILVRSTSCRSGC